MTPIEQLRSQYPWPEKCPPVAPKNHGWFSGNGIFEQWVTEKTRTILEVGSWMGYSARWFCRHAPQADVICIDHWEGSEEHHRREEWKAMLPDLYETFLASCWEFRKQIIPVKTDSLSGMKLVRELGIKPEAVYIDAAHDQLSVYNDTLTAIACFPDAQIFGDDWQHKPLEAGVIQALEELGMRNRLKTQRRIWYLEK